MPATTRNRQMACQKPTRRKSGWLWYGRRANADIVAMKRIKGTESVADRRLEGGNMVTCSKLTLARFAFCVSYRLFPDTFTTTTEHMPIELRGIVFRSSITETACDHIIRPISFNWGPLIAHRLLTCSDWVIAMRILTYFQVMYRKSTSLLLSCH